MRNAPELPKLPTGRRLLSQTAEHALRAALFLGRHAAEELVSASTVAAALGTPPNYTAKTLRLLSRKGLLRSERGPRGGFALRVEPAALSVGRLVEAVDEAAERRDMCLLGDHPCDATHPCVAHGRWTEVQEQARALLERTTVADLLGAASTRGAA
jgi:Rrf2 family protein